MDISFGSIKTPGWFTILPTTILSVLSEKRQRINYGLTVSQNFRGEKHKTIPNTRNDPSLQKRKSPNYNFNTTTISPFPKTLEYPNPTQSLAKMGRPKRNLQAAADETSTPPPALTPTQSIARVVRAAGNNLYLCALPNTKELLAELPSRFRNTIWIKRGGYVLVDTKDGEVRENKLGGEILNVVRDEREWRKEAYW